MVVVAEVMGLVHALDFVRLHDAEVMVDADVVHVVDHHVQIDRPVPLVVAAMVAIDLLDTGSVKTKKKLIKLVIGRKEKLLKKIIELKNCWIECGAYLM